MATFQFEPTIEYDFLQERQNSIIIGSDARGEKTPLHNPLRRVETIGLLYSPEGMYIEYGNHYDGEPNSCLLSEFEHPEQILDSYTESLDLKPMLNDAKAFLMSDYVPDGYNLTMRNLTLKRLRDTALKHRRAVNSEHYKYGVLNEPQHNLEDAEFYYDQDNRQFSTKYTYLRTIQYLMLSAITKFCPEFFISGSAPTLRNKVTWLSKFIPQFEIEKALSNGKCKNLDITNVDDLLRVTMDVYESALISYSICMQDFVDNRQQGIVFTDEELAEKLGKDGSSVIELLLLLTRSSST